MFYSVKASNYTQRDKRRQDMQDSIKMEERLQTVIEQQNREALELAAKVATPRSRIATPGSRTPFRREPGTPARRGGRIGL